MAAPTLFSQYGARGRNVGGSQRKTFEEKCEVGVSVKRQAGHKRSAL